MEITKKGGVRKAPHSGLYSGTCSKMIFRYIVSLLIYLCMLMIIKYTLMIMVYRRPPKLSGDKQRQCHNGTRRTYCKPTLRNTRSLPLIQNLPRKPLGMHWRWNFDGHDVKSSDYLKILGVTIDNKLTFSDHISYICKKTSCKVEALLRLRNLIPWSAKLQLYKSNILPHLTYCDIVWYFCKSSDKKKIERI